MICFKIALMGLATVMLDVWARRLKAGVGKLEI
jgi:hypothetical protein